MAVPLPPKNKLKARQLCRRTPLLNSYWFHLLMGSRLAGPVRINSGLSSDMRALKEESWWRVRNSGQGSTLQ